MLIWMKDGGYKRLGVSWVVSSYMNLVISTG